MLGPDASAEPRTLIYPQPLEAWAPCVLSKEYYWELERLLTDRFSCFSPQGASPAAGCLIALTCDYRIMADNPKYTIGLNESLLGIVAHFW